MEPLDPNLTLEPRKAQRGALERLRAADMDVAKRGELKVIAERRKRKGRMLRCWTRKPAPHRSAGDRRALGIQRRGPSREEQVEPIRLSPRTKDSDGTGAPRHGREKGSGAADDGGGGSAGERARGSLSLLVRNER